MNGLNKFKKVFTAIAICVLVLSNLGFTNADAKPSVEAHKYMPFAKGFDASYVKRVEDKGGVYKTAEGETKDVFKILAANGVNYVRFRLWNNPAEGYCSKADVLALAKRARAAGLKIMLDFHYSDFWADPSKQNKPAAWEGLAFAQLNQAVYAYTYDVVKSMNEQHTPPDIVEIGNEITHGMLWPDGHVFMNDPTYDTPTQWSNLASLVNSGIRGVRAAHSRAKIMIHIASGDNAEMRWFFDHLLAHGIDFDILGLSYYHNWHGTFDQFSANLSDMATRYGKPIIIAETAYPFTLGWNDWTNNNIGLESQLAPGYPATPEGQTAFLQAVVDMAKAIPNGRGVGVFYWGGEWIATSPQDTNGSSWENQTLFDFNSVALPAFKVFKHTH